jgi:hypothetical protein
MAYLPALLIGGIAIHDFICIIEKFIPGRCRFCQSFWLSIFVSGIIYFDYTFVLWPFCIHDICMFLDKFYLNNVKNVYLVHKEQKDE